MHSAVTHLEAVEVAQKYRSVVRKPERHRDRLRLLHVRVRHHDLLLAALGLVKERGKIALADDKKPYTVLQYSSGPGAKAGERADLSKSDVLDVDFIQQALVPLPSETHAGEDVGIWAVGPWAHLYQGTVDENYTFMVIDKALDATARLAAKK